MEKMLSQTRRNLKLLAAAPVIVACLEILWNLPLSRFPIYWLPTYSPLPALLLNAFIHIIFTGLPVMIVGCLLFRFIRFKETIPVFLLVAAACYIIYMGITALGRVWGLYDEPTWPDFTKVSIGWSVGVIIAAVGSGILLRRAIRSGRNITWLLTVAISTPIAIVAVILRWPNLSIGYLWLICGCLALAHIIVAIISRRCQPPSRVLAKYLLILTTIAVIIRIIWIVSGAELAKNNIIAVVWDATRADRMSVYNNEISTTPYLQSLAEKSLIFNSTHSPCNYTFPSHVSMFTGLHGTEHQCWYGDASIREYEDYSILAEDLKENGYRTLMITENTWITQLDYGFDFLFWIETPRVSPSKWGKPPCTGTPMAFPFLQYCSSPFLMRQLIDQVVFWKQGWFKTIYHDYELRLIQEQIILRRSSQPLFVFINWMDVHNRYHPHSSYENKKKIRPYDLSREYDEAIKYSDKRFEELIEIFREANELEKSLFILTSDHGQLHGEYDIWGHGKSLFESVLRVPLIFIYERWNSGSRVETPISLVSIKRVINYLALTDISSDSEIFRKKIIKEFDTPQGVVAEHRSERRNIDGLYSWGFTYIAADGSKLIYDPILKIEESSWAEQSHFLFNVNSDPNELNNLYNKDPERRRQIGEEYKNWRESHPLGKMVGQDEYPPKLIDELRALGYIK